MKLILYFKLKKNPYGCKKIYQWKISSRNIWKIVMFNVMSDIKRYIINNAIITKNINNTKQNDSPVSLLISRKNIMIANKMRG